MQRIKGFREDVLYVCVCTEASQRELYSGNPARSKHSTLIVTTIANWLQLSVVQAVNLIIAGGFF